MNGEAQCLEPSSPGTTPPRCRHCAVLIGGVCQCDCFSCWDSGPAAGEPAMGAPGEALEASKAVLLAAQGVVKAAEEAVAAAAEADFRGKAVLLAAQGAVKAAEEAVLAAAEVAYFSSIGRL